MNLGDNGDNTFRTEESPPRNGDKIEIKHSAIRQMEQREIIMRNKLRMIDRQREKAEQLAKKTEYKISRELEILEHKQSLAT